MQKANRGSIAPFDASDWKIGIVAARFNTDITGQLYQSAIDRAADYQIPAGNITTIEVAGAVEIPVALQHLAEARGYDALLAIGCVINGATPHFDYVCKFVTEGVLRVQLDYKLPIGFGLLTCNDEAQARDRAHLGGEHLDAVLHLRQALKS